MLEKILEGTHLKRLDNIKQWSEMDVFKQESVSQHSYKVAVLCRVLLDDVLGHQNSFGISEFKLKCVTYALFHDWDEAIILRDLSHEFKYNEFNGEEIRGAVDHFSIHSASKEFAESDESGRSTESSDTLVCCSTGQVGERVKTVVKFCDWLSLLFYIQREKSLGNNNLSRQEKYCIDNIRRMKKDFTRIFFIEAVNMGKAEGSLKVNLQTIKNL